MNVAWTQAAEGLPRRAFTVEDIRRMVDAGVIGEDENFELVEGELVMMASKGIAHERIKSAVLIAVARALPSELTLGVEATLRLTDRTMLEPDLAVFPASVFRQGVSGFASLQPGEARLVVEVAVSSMSYDRGLKARLYSRHCVQEFWVIDANERITWVHTQPDGDTWGSIVERKPGDALTTPALPGFSIRLADIG
jgi:Uma2 family endonuclease